MLVDLLAITVFQAKDLPKADLLGKSDPFVQVCVGDSRKSTKVEKSRWVYLLSERHRSSTLSRALDRNPVWNQRFDYSFEQKVSSQSSHKTSLKLKIP